MFLAADARGVSAVAIGSGFGRRGRLQAFHRVELEPGALVPSAVGANVKRPGELQAAFRRAVASVGQARAVSLVLPDEVARLALLELPPRVAVRQYLLYRLGPSLPWPAAESIMEALPVGRKRIVGAAVRRTTVVEYEEQATAAGLEVERVHLAGLLALAGLGRAKSRSRSQHAVHVLLGDETVSFVVSAGAKVLALAQRRRDHSAGEADRLVAGAARAARLAGDGSSTTRLSLAGSDSLRLAGEGASLVAELAGPAGPPGWPQAAEAAWLHGLLT